MFISIRGTNGSGKTTLVRNLIKQSKHEEAVYKERRKRPAYNIYNIILGVNTKLRYATMGHYDTACGGCDTINKADTVLEWAKEAFEFHKVDAVLSEGMIISKDVSRITQLPEPVIIYLNLPLGECFQGVYDRRVAKGDTEKAKTPPKTLEGNFKGVDSACRRLKAAGKVKVVEVNKRSDALPTLEKILSRIGV